MGTSEYLDVVLEAYDDCGGNCWWCIHRINDHTLPFIAADGLADYSPLLNQFGNEGWELISIISFPDGDSHSEYRTARFQRSSDHVGGAWDYAMVMLHDAVVPHDSKHLLDVTDPQRLREARRQVAGHGWRVVQAVINTWGWPTLEVILKRPRPRSPSRNLDHHSRDTSSPYHNAE